jgi:oxygen-independent coproporphyrinogen-3 oxidase
VPRPFGVYVHFPYCAHRCPYCDFAVTTEPVPGERRYARAVLAELQLRAPGFDGLAPASLYLGGGTPSLWEPDEVAEVVAAIRARFSFPAAAEITIEVNPESTDRGRLRALVAAGVNRVSVGVQSFDPAVLAKLGRRHGPEDAEAAIRLAAEETGNASVDLIYGARRSTVAIARADAARAVAAGAVHVSAYQLTLDPEVLAEEVPLARMRREGRLPLPDDDDALRQGAAIRAVLRRAGLRRYEISNYARPGKESVHNRLYWESESYLGLGAGAYGCLRAWGSGGREPAGQVPPRSEAGAVRYGNLRSATAYVEAALAGRLATAEEDRIDLPAARNEALMLALRTVRGADLAALSPAQAREAGEAVRRRLAVRRAGRLVLTSRGMDLHSALSERLFE